MIKSNVIVKGAIEPADVQGVSAVYAQTDTSPNAKITKDEKGNYVNSVTRAFTKGDPANKGDVTQPRNVNKA